MQISVVIPVYNAERYVRSAVESALQQPQTAEVILIDDKSPDNALAVCEALAKEDERVRILTHSDGKNHGAGESRNLGITSARHEHIAFLDADDYYLPDCFAAAARIFDNDPTVDGVYSAVGAEFENEEARRRYFSTHEDEVATVDECVTPDQLFRFLVQGGAGYIHLNGLVVTKTGLQRAGLLPRLRLHQDMVLTIKLAALLKLVAGDVKTPVSMRRLHLENRITNLKTNFGRTQYLAYRSLVQWSREEHLDGDRHRMLRDKYWRLGYRYFRGTGNYPVAAWYYGLFHLFPL